MPKNIILCSDGTGNTGIEGRGTNVFKLFEAVDLNGHRTNPLLDYQLAFYDDGVGTEGMALKRTFGGATGWGLNSNVKQLYRELSRVYDEGDRIFLFGFSRGAFTVRTVAGMIGTCGILKGESFETARDLRRAVDATYVAYRARYSSALTRVADGIVGRLSGQEAIDAFHERFKNHLNESFTISFIGVWDTVDAIGLPFALSDIVNRYVFQFKFPTKGLGAHIEKACQALSIDDPRVAFGPVLWDGPDDRVEQVWFSGVHSNVGGGYPKQGMSLVALDWMLSHAAKKGLRLQPIDHELFRGHASVDDMLYDPRSGLGLFYRWLPRDLRAHCKQRCETPRIHLTVAERIAHGTDDYAPGNIPPDVTVVATQVEEDDPDHEKKNHVLRQRVDAVEVELRRALAQGGYLLDQVRHEIHLGEASYWCFVFAWFLLAFAALASVQPKLLMVWPSAWSISAFGAAMIAFAAAWFLGRVADQRMSNAFSLFWQKHQKVLRAALKQAHQDAKREKTRATGASRIVLDQGDAGLSRKTHPARS
jgi:uncharacterized protein (DUF2235 family)